MIAAVISDTHMPRGARELPEACVERLRAADLVLHAGDLADVTVLEQLEALTPRLLAVHGNVDSAELRRRLPGALRADVDGAVVAMVHDAGPAPGRLERMRRRFPDVDAVVFGHSHIPLHEEAEGFQIFNPGSPTERRRARHHTMGLLEAEAGRARFTLVRLD